MNKNARIVITTILATLLVVLLIQNARPVEATLFFWPVRLPLFVHFLLVAACGFLLGRFAFRRRR
ncbi:MAG: hypothetical protein EA425_07055 [Puniceicoccaceae bacterium]|nr:MAG: hypothetical protein EA425_07055 [Puniceicoccaceae bacterium]